MIPTTQTWRIGDSVDLIRELPAESIDTIITSPPYWSLRDYQVDGQIGLEGTLAEYHRRLLEVTAECMRVLKPTGVMFWNHGDNYASSGGASRHKGYSDPKYPNGRTGDFNEPSAYPQGNIQPKSLFMQNERLIIQMIDEQGWILRNRIIWEKPNVIPSSATDRFSNKYESVYMLTKQGRYWFDLDAVRKPYTKPLNRWGGQNLKANGKSSWDSGTGQNSYRDRDMRPNPLGKNPGDVWFLEDYHFNRLYELNERYFETILTEEQAYWLGFLWGAGSISDGSRVRLSLQAMDKEHVTRFKNAINSEHPIKSISNGIGIEIRCAKMVQDLEKLGLKEKFPQIPTFLYRHFIRGVFDADGSIHEGRPGEYEVSITNGNTNILSIIGTIVSDEIGSKQKNITKDKSVWRIRWGGADQCRGIRDYLYSGSNVFLPRKFKKFPEGKIKRSKNTDLWTIPTHSYSGSHFATFPPALVEPLVKVACPAEICPACGLARERITEKEVEFTSGSGKAGNPPKGKYEGSAQAESGTYDIRMGPKVTYHTIGWTDCGCDAGWIAGTVLDPFCGSGTVLEVCRRLNRNAIGFELNPDYEPLIRERSMAHTPPLTSYFGGNE